MVAAILKNVFQGIDYLVIFPSFEYLCAVLKCSINCLQSTRKLCKFLRWLYRIIFSPQTLTIVITGDFIFHTDDFNDNDKNISPFWTNLKSQHVKEATHCKGNTPSSRPGYHKGSQWFWSLGRPGRYGWKTYHDITYWSYWTNLITIDHFNDLKRLALTMLDLNTSV